MNETRNRLTVRAIGSLVKLSTECTGIITEISIKQKGYVVYLVSWMNEGCHYDKYMTEAELVFYESKLSASNKTTIITEIE